MKKLLLALAVVLAAAALWWMVSRPETLKVRTVTVERGPVSSSVTNTRAGTVDACRRAGISPTIGGQVAKLLASKGERVESGQLLLELWNDDRQAELTLAQREADAARARATEACVVARVARDEARRQTQLMGRRLTSEEAVNKAEGDAEARAAACEAARSSVQVSEARVAVNQAVLERTRLRAPFDGVIAEINGELGEFVTPSPVGIPTPPTVDLIDSTCLYISAPIDEIDAPAVREGMRVRISLDAFGDRTFSGHVRRVAPYVLDLEKQARTVEIEAEIDDPDRGHLLPGYSADVEVLLDSRDEVLRLPTSVIIGGDRVLRLDAGGIIVEQTVQTGLANWEYTEVVSGLAEGDQVISSIDRAGVEPGAVARAE